ncbi:MAG: FMN-binding negative transcriptional regulator, partial [Kordia sp.]|uniref:FMN-binding negative transcriptional regulator n=1 Tax=Kordia sp. TaxID=1965332 RepID=UPI003858D477
AIFHGPDCYISPNVYSTTQLPTWNYVKVHISAKATRMPTNDSLIHSIAEMTSFLENSQKPYVLDVKNPRVQTLADYIIGFRLEITAWEGKFKLSQDKLPKDRQLAKEELIKKSRQDVTTFLNNII